MLAADQFVVATAAGVTVCAGYPWFGEWSRDAMTSYEGFFLSTGRAAEGRSVLTRAAATLSEGMLANTTDSGAAQYNTADATLWFVHAIGRHVTVTGDVELAAELSGAIDELLERHLRRNPLRHRRRRRRRAAAPGRRGSRADLDGCPGRRSAGDAARRQGRRDQRAVDQRPAHSRVAFGPRRRLAAPLERTRRPGRGSFAERFGEPTGAAWWTWSTAPRAMSWR